MQSKSKNKLFILSLILNFLLLIFLLISFKIPELVNRQEPENESRISFVQRVIDGDTFVLENGDRVRLIGIDTPEKDEPCFQEAKEALERLTLNKSVLLQSDITPKDKYDRYLYWVYLDDQNINFKMVESGMAKAVIYEGQKYAEELLEIENKASELKIECK